MCVLHKICHLSVHIVRKIQKFSRRGRKCFIIGIESLLCFMLYFMQLIVARTKSKSLSDVYDGKCSLNGGFFVQEKFD